MNKDGNTLLTTYIIIIGLLFATVSLYMVKESEKDKRINLQKQVEELLSKEQDLDAKIKDMELANAQMAANTKFQEEKISMISKYLEDERAANSKNLAKMQEKEFEIQSLKAKIEEAKTDKESAASNLEKLNENYLNMKFQLENLLKTKEELEKKAKDVAEKEGISLGTVVIKR